MKYYKEFAQKMILTFDDVIVIVGNRHTAARIVADYASKGLLIKVKRDLYVVASMENGGVIPNENQIGCALKPNAFISHHSALVLYGYYNQVYSTIDVSSPTRFDPIFFEGKEYRHHHSSWLEQVETMGNSVRVTTIERTMIDSIKDLKKTMDFEELIRCLELVPWANEQALLKVLSHYDNQLLWKKAGYVLGHCKIRFTLSESFYTTCRSKGKTSVGYFCSDSKTTQRYDKEWGLFVPKMQSHLEGFPDVLL